MMAPPRTHSPEPARPAFTPVQRPATPFFTATHRPLATTTGPATAPPGRPAPGAGPARAARPGAGVAGGTGLLAALPSALRPLAGELAGTVQQQAPYHLLTLGLGYDPLTGQARTRSPQAVGHALLGLLPQGEARYQQLQQAGPALAQLPAWFADQLAAHNISGARLARLLAQTLAQLHALAWDDLLDLGGVVRRLTQPWLALGADVLHMVVTLEVSLLRLVVRAVLGAQAQPLLDALDQAGDLLVRILRHPLPFLRTLVEAARLGFHGFVAKAPQYLQAAAEQWLFGPLANEGIRVPKAWTLRSMLDLLLQVLGLTKQHVLARLRERVTAEVGPEAAARIEQFGAAATTLLEQGPLALWHDIVAQAGNLLTQAFDAVQGQVVAMLTQGVARLLVKLAIPGGALVQVLQTAYDVYQTLVTRGRELAQVGLTLFGAARRLEQGDATLAAKSLEAVLARLLPVALDFLARTFSLDKLPKLLRIGLNALRRPVEKGVNWVLDKIIRLAQKAWQGVKKGGAAAVQAVGLLNNFFGFRTKVDAGSQEQHHLYFQQRNGKTTLIIESTPQEVRDFLAVFARKYPGKRIDILLEINNHLNSYDPLYAALQPDPTVETFAAKRVRAQLLAKNDLLSNMLRRLLMGDPKSPLLAPETARYKLEGITGIYANRPEITGDKLTFDHQPQAAVWEVASKLEFKDAAGRTTRLFATSSPLAKRAANRADNGYAINLSAVRHQLGRTYGTPGRQTKEAFETAAEAIVDNQALSEQDKRNRIVEMLKEELRLDIATMLRVIQPDNAAAWTDINGLGLTETVRDQLQDTIIARIKQGERELQNQPMAQLRAGS